MARHGRRGWRGIPTDTLGVWRNIFHAATARGSEKLESQRGQGRVHATQLREVDKTRAALILSYDLSNMSNVDYRLTDGSGVVVMSRLKSDGSLSQEQRIRLSYPVFLPAGQRAHLAFEITREFVWPKDDSHHDEKLKEFVRQMLAPVRGFVLFDDSSHSQFDLPAGWPDLQETSETRPRG